MSSSRIRQARETVCGHLYKRVEIRRVYVNVAGKELLCEPCAYCGMPLEVLDHVPPICMAEAIADLPSIRRPRFMLVPACSDCNGLLGSKALPTVRDRAAYVHQRFVSRLKKIRCPVWTEEELADMGPNMRREIERHRRRTDVLCARIHWAALAADGVDPVVVLDCRDGSAA